MRESSLYQDVPSGCVGGGVRAPCERYCREAYPNETDGICGRAKEYYLTFMQDMPDLGENMIAKNMLDWFTILFFYESSGEKILPETVQEMMRRALYHIKWYFGRTDLNTDKGKAENKKSMSLPPSVCRIYICSS